MSDVNLEGLIASCVALETEDFVQLINALESERRARAAELRRAAEKQANLLLAGKVTSAPKATRGPNRTKRVLPPKYRHPETGETWTGFGAYPRWVADYLNNGGRLPDILIKD